MENKGKKKKKDERGPSAFSHHLRLVVVLRYTAAGCCVFLPYGSLSLLLHFASLVVMKRVRVFPLSATLFFSFSVSPTRFSGVMKLITLRALYSSTSLSLSLSLLPSFLLARILAYLYHARWVPSLSLRFPSILFALLHTGCAQQSLSCVWINDNWLLPLLRCYRGWELLPTVPPSRNNLKRAPHTEKS